MNQVTNIPPSVDDYLNQYMKDCLKSIGQDLNDIKSISRINYNKPGAGYTLIYYNNELYFYKNKDRVKIYIRSLAL